MNSEILQMVKHLSVQTVKIKHVIHNTSHYLNEAIIRTRLRTSYAHNHTWRNVCVCNCSTYITIATVHKKVSRITIIYYNNKWAFTFGGYTKIYKDCESFLPPRLHGIGYHVQTRNRAIHNKKVPLCYNYITVQELKIMINHR